MTRCRTSYWTRTRNSGFLFTLSFNLQVAPTSEAGLRVEDVIISIGGKAVNELSLDTIEEMFSHIGRDYDSTILRGKELLKTKINSGIYFK